MPALVALDLLVGSTALLWVGVAAVRTVAHRRGTRGRRLSLTGVPELFLASAVGGVAAVFLDAAQ